MQAKTREQTDVLDKQLSVLVKKSVEGCTPTTGAWLNIAATIQSGQSSIPTLKNKKTTLAKHEVTA